MSSQLKIINQYFRRMFRKVDSNYFLGLNLKPSWDEPWGMKTCFGLLSAVILRINSTAIKINYEKIKSIFAIGCSGFSLISDHGWKMLGINFPTPKS